MLDSMRTITGGVGIVRGDQSGAFYNRGLISQNSAGNKGSYPEAVLDSSRLGAGYGGTETAPTHVWQPIILYLGRSA